MLSQPDGDRHRGEGAETDVPSIEALLIPYARLSGYENMAVDEYLIRLHESAGAPLFRVYGWGTPAISLGRYQKPDCLDLEACARDGIEVVRRITGGGAIFHDDEVTYSFVCSDTALLRILQRTRLRGQCRTHPRRSAFPGGRNTTFSLMA
jgi:lipoate-protein ligase A